MNFCSQINISHVQDSNRNLKREQYESFERSRDPQRPGTYSHLLCDIRHFLFSSKAYFCPTINLAPRSQTDTQTDICDVQIHRAFKVPQSTQTGVRGLVPLSSQAFALHPNRDQTGRHEKSRELLKPSLGLHKQRRVYFSYRNPIRAPGSSIAQFSLRLATEVLG